MTEFNFGAREMEPQHPARQGGYSQIGEGSYRLEEEDYSSTAHAQRSPTIQSNTKITDFHRSHIYLMSYASNSP